LLQARLEHPLGLSGFGPGSFRPLSGVVWACFRLALSIVSVRLSWRETRLGHHLNWSGFASHSLARLRLVSSIIWVRLGLLQACSEHRLSLLWARFEHHLDPSELASNSLQASSSLI
jgi:hypothetical protein